VDCAIRGIDTWNWRAGEWRVDAIGHVILPVAEIPPDQRGKSAAQTTVLTGRTVLHFRDVVAIVLIFDDTMWRLRRALLPHDLNEFRALFPQDPLHAANGVALTVEEMANSAQKIDVIGAIVTPAAAAFHRFDFVEAAFPKAQHVLWQIEFVCHFTDGAKCVWRLVIQSDLAPL
jgi:hypothetical protein